MGRRGRGPQQDGTVGMDFPQVRHFLALRTPLERSNPAIFANSCPAPRTVGTSEPTKMILWVRLLE